MMSLFKLARQWYKGRNENSSWPSHECRHALWGDREGKGVVTQARLGRLCGMAPPEYKTGTKPLEAAGSPR